MPPNLDIILSLFKNRPGETSPENFWCRRPTKLLFGFSWSRRIVCLRPGLKGRRRQAEIIMRRFGELVNNISSTEFRNSLCKFAFQILLNLCRLRMYTLHFISRKSKFSRLNLNNFTRKNRKPSMTAMSALKVIQNKFLGNLGWVTCTLTSSRSHR